MVKLHLAEGRSLVLVNPDTSSHKYRDKKYILAFGAYGWTVLCVWARSIDSALEEAADWLEKNAPGLFCDEAVNEEYDRAIKEGKTEEEAWEESQVDTISLDGGHFLNSWEVSIVAEKPTRAQFLLLMKDFEVVR